MNGVLESGLEKPVCKMLLMESEGPEQPISCSFPQRRCDLWQSPEREREA